MDDETQQMFNECETDEEREILQKHFDAAMLRFLMCELDKKFSEKERMEDSKKKRTFFGKIFNWMGIKE